MHTYGPSIFVSRFLLRVSSVEPRFAPASPSPCAFRVGGRSATLALPDEGRGEVEEFQRISLRKRKDLRRFFEVGLMKGLFVTCC